MDLVTSHIAYLENISSLSYADVPNATTYHYTIKKIVSVNITIDLLRKKQKLVLGSCQAYRGNIAFAKFEV